MARNIYTSDQVPDKQDYGGYASNQKLGMRIFLFSTIFDMESPFSLVPGLHYKPSDLDYIGFILPYFSIILLLSLFLSKS